MIHYRNALLDGADRAGLQAHFLRVLAASPKLGAAWKQAGYQRSERGWDWLRRVEAIRDAPEFEDSGFDPKDAADIEFAGKMARSGVNLTETLACLHFLQGPALNVHEMRFQGPLVPEPKRLPISFGLVDHTDAPENSASQVAVRLATSTALAPANMQPVEIPGWYEIDLDLSIFQPAYEGNLRDFGRPPDGRFRRRTGAFKLGLHAFAAGHLPKTRALHGFSTEDRRKAPSTAMTLPAGSAIS